MSLSTQSCPQPPFQPFTTLLLGPLCSSHLGLYAVGVCMCLNRLRMFHQKVFVLYSSCPYILVQTHGSFSFKPLTKCTFIKEGHSTYLMQHHLLLFLLSLLSFLHCIYPHPDYISIALSHYRVSFTRSGIFVFSLLLHLVPETGISE